MRNAILLLAAALLAPAALAQGPDAIEHVVYLHENPLHILPETVNARVGQTLRFAVENPEAPNKTIHDLLVCGEAPHPTPSCNEVWARVPPIQPGASAQLTFNVTRAGTFEYWCTIAGHKDGGMVGTLVVQGAPEERGLPAPGVVVLAFAFALAFALVRRRRA